MFLTLNQFNFLKITGKRLPYENIKVKAGKYYFEHFDSNGNRTYYEDSRGYWERQGFKNNKCVYYADSTGFWSVTHYDSRGNVIARKISNGYWCIFKYDKHNNIVFFKNSDNDFIIKQFKNNKCTYHETNDGIIKAKINVIDFIINKLNSFTLFQL